MPDAEEKAANALIAPYAQVLANICGTLPLQSYEAVVVTSTGQRYAIKVTLEDKDDD